jgi:hypothetical protein
MFSLKDILEILDHWPVWKKIKATPENLEALEKRVIDLEKRLARCPGEACPKCGELSYRVVSSQPNRMMPEVGVVDRVMKCQLCGFTERRTITA